MTIPDGSLVQHTANGKRYHAWKPVNRICDCIPVDNGMQSEKIPEHFLKLVGGPDQSNEKARLLVIEDRLDKLQAAANRPTPIDTFANRSTPTRPSTPQKEGESHDHAI